MTEKVINPDAEEIITELKGEVFKMNALGEVVENLNKEDGMEAVADFAVRVAFVANRMNLIAGKLLVNNN